MRLLSPARPAWLAVLLVLPAGSLRAEDAPMPRVVAAVPAVAGPVDPVVDPTRVADPNMPVVQLFYRGANHKQDFKFRHTDRGEFVRTVGDLSFDPLPGALPAGGMEANQRGFCAEPLVPIYAGQTYQFQVEPIDLPKTYGLPDTPDGKALASRRATYIREFYGRYYEQSVQDPATNAAAFQAGLWELTQEPELPDGPLPFNLFAGGFRASYANEAEAPAFVRAAQERVQSLTGDDSAYLDSTLLRRQELVRLTGLAGPDAVVPQSQFTLRPAPGSVGGGGGAPGGGFPTGGPGAIGGGGVGPLGGGPLGGGFGGGGVGTPFLGGFGGNNPGTVPTVIPPGSIDQPGADSPQLPETPENPPVPPQPPEPPEPPQPPVPPQPPQPPQPPEPPEPPQPPEPPTPVPAPAGVVLLLVGAGALAVRRRLKKG